MTTIDQRILIPAAQTVVWAYISNINNNSEWQAECKSVSYLTSRREGPGTRWRYTTDKKREYVVEITAWYNGLGYEYVFIDGPGYKENRGRIRLQEIAEGTIVQWTFSYELGGMLANLRNHRRQIENTMAASLKELYRKLKQYAAENKGDPKSLMRDAPDVEARSQYRPRHPSVAPKQQEQEGSDQLYRPAQTPVVFEEPPIVEGDAQTLPTFVFDEPPIEADDTRPRAAVSAAEVAETAETKDEAQEVYIDESRFEPPRESEDTLRREVSAPAPEPETAVEEVAEPQPFITAPFETAAVSEEPESAPVVEAVESIEVEQTPEEEEAPSTVPTTAKHEAVEIPSAAEPTPAAAPVEADPMLPAPGPEQTAASIWEIFGVPRPSETQEARASASASEQTAPKAQVKAGLGLRVRLRRSLTRLRRPF